MVKAKPRLGRLAFKRFYSPQRPRCIVRPRGQQMILSLPGVRQERQQSLPLREIIASYGAEPSLELSLLRHVCRLELHELPDQRKRAPRQRSAQAEA